MPIMKYPEWMHYHSVVVENVVSHDRYRAYTFLSNSHIMQHQKYYTMEVTLFMLIIKKNPTSSNAQ